MKYRREIPSKSGKAISLLVCESSKHPKATIIESHGGIRNSAEETAKQSSKLIESYLISNYNYIAIDFSNNGTRSDQPENETLFSDRVRDLESTIDYVQNEFHSPVILYGSSLGGHVTLFAANYSDSIKGIILNCPALRAYKSIRDTMDPEQFKFWEINKVADHDFVDVKNIPYSFYEDLNSHVALDLIPTTKVPMLIFQGTADKVTPAEDSRKAKILNTQIDLIEIEGGGHRFGDKMQSDGYIIKVQNFISSIL